MSIRKFQVLLVVDIKPAIQPAKSRIRLQVDVFSAAHPIEQKQLKYNFDINTIPININLSQPIIATAKDFLRQILDVYVDEERELKTLLNYGEDRQSVVLSYRRGPFDLDGINTIQLKLLQPVPDEIVINEPVFLSREVAKSVIDKIRVRFTPEIDTTPYLRPKNLNVKVDLDTGRSLKNVTFDRLSLQSGSVGLEDAFRNKNFEDQIFRQWYSYDFNSSELNIDFSDYSNFIWYSSAAMRLAAFNQKMQQIETLENLRNQILSSYAANTASAGIVFLNEKSAEYSLQKENIIRSFDRYEQYLYFTPSGSENAYSASFDYVDGGVEYNPIGYWPKFGSAPVSVTSSTATEWYESQSAIAQRFDEFNENNLVNTIPNYLRDDHDSSAYITFVSMIGHLFDTIKPYIDQYPNIYSRNLDPNEEISKDLVSEVAESIGFVMPTIDSVYNLTDNILGSSGEQSRRDLAVEVYKRLLHNLPFFAKAKGTKTALESLLKTFGITSQLISVKETGTPTVKNYKVFDEYTSGLDFDEAKTSFIRLPVSASNRTTTTLQINFTVAKNKGMTILTGDDKWALNVVRHPSIATLGRFEIRSGSSNTRIITSSYYSIFGDELLNFAVQTYNNTSSLYFTQVDGDDTVFSQTIIDTSRFPKLWNTTDYVFLGGAGARVSGRFDGTLDEVRLWGSNLSEEVILKSAFDPGSNAGDTYADASNNLYVQISFNNITSASLTTSSILNESPYKDKTLAPSLETLFVSNISASSVVRYNRVVKQDMPLVGSSGYVTNKIVIADSPKFINSSDGLRLYRDKSIVKPETKKFFRGRNKVIVSMSPTEIVNQNIIRNFGLENINSILGSPTTIYTNFQKSLTTLRQHYQQYYYVDVNYNRFIRILSDLGSVLDQIVDYFIPSKATLLSGVVIEPNILEQVKIPPLKNIRFYGKNARKTLNAAGSLTGSATDYAATFNVTTEVNVNPNSTAAYSTYASQQNVIEKVTFSGKAAMHTSSVMVVPVPSASYAYHKANFSGNTSNVVADLDQYQTVAQYKADLEKIPANITSSFASLTTAIDPPRVIFSGSYPTININIPPSSVLPELDNSGYVTYRIEHEDWNYSGPTRDSRIDSMLHTLNKIKYNQVNNGSEGAEPYNRLYTRKLFSSEIQTTRNGGETSIYVPALYDIPPSADFRDPGVYTFFNNTEGIYYFNEIRKVPVYPKPLKVTWDFDNQSFGGMATTWSYGARYNIYDVVYQDISTTDKMTIPTLASMSVNAGNKRYYVFKSRPVYAIPTDGTAFNSGSVPSYTPPSLDQDNWELLRFRPVQVRIPKRVVFDTFTVSDPAVNNFKLTTIDTETVINIPDRYIDSYNLGSVPPSSYSVGELSVQNISVLFAMQTNTSGLRVRLYRTPTARDVDLNRSFETRPTGSHGVLLDTYLSTTDAIEISNPIPTLVADGIPPAGKLYYTINNLDSVGKPSVALLLYYFALEIEPRVPVGYLRKHYKFFRDNSTATKRRNYLGCKNTIDTTIDGLSPIQIFVGEGTEIKVSPSSLNQEIITGGGGTLNVT